MKWTLLLALTLMLSSCGDDKKGSKYSPLNSDQKSKFASVFESAGNTLQAPIEVHKKNGGLDSVHGGQNKQQMKQQIEKQKCNIEYKKGEFNPAFSIERDLTTYLKVNGNLCPIAMDTQLTLVPGQQSVGVNFSANYAVLSEDYKKLNDVVAFGFKGNGSVTVSEDNNFQASGTSTGSLTSVQYGVVGIDFSVNSKKEGDHGEMLVVATFNFSDFTAELKMIQEGSVNGQLTQEIYLNDEKLNTQQSKNILASNFAGFLQNL